ncbi:MAG: glycosyltransferase [Ginsengibacter sp.]
MNILNIVTGIGKESFGLGQISVNLASAQLSQNNDVEIWCLDNNENINWASEAHNFPVERISTFKLIGPKKIWYSRQIEQEVEKVKNNNFEIVHQHGIWTGISRATLKFSKKKNIPTIIAPHGSLNNWVLNLSKWKKKIALAGYENENLKMAACLHATSENEIKDFRNFGLKNPIAYIQNGIQENNLHFEGDANAFRKKYMISEESRIILFLSRISPKKGLSMLVEAVHSIRDDFNGWRLIIAGVDEFEHKKEVESQVKQLNLQHLIEIIGPLFDQAKKNAFAAAELFILPSYSEGSPMVVLDSLAAGVPVITTKASSWSDLNDYNCGWWTEVSTLSIVNALREAVNMAPKDLHQMGENGRKLIASKYTWSQLAQKTTRLYNWLLGRDSKPDFVQMD